MPDLKSCFVIAPIGTDGSETRVRSDQILRHVITPACLECGYKAIRADKISEPGLITSQVIQHVVDDPLVIADLTDRNPNVFYELALRHALRKPVVQLIKSGEAIPFDVAASRTIHVDHRDLDSVDRAKVEIVAQIRAVEANPTDIDTPISVAVDLQMLRNSDNPVEKSNAEIMTMLQELRHDNRLMMTEFFERSSMERKSRIPRALLEDLAAVIDNRNEALSDFDGSPSSFEQLQFAIRRNNERGDSILAYLCDVAAISKAELARQRRKSEEPFVKSRRADKLSRDM